MQYPIRISGGIMKNYSKSFCFMIFFFGIILIKEVPAATIYVDNSVSSDCLGNYSVANRNCSGNGATSYNTIQKAVLNCSPGDVIYMRGGTYREIDIDIPTSKNGTSWAAGSFTTLASYPGEWAVIDGSGLNTNLEYRYQHIIRHPTSYVTGGMNGATKYWLFERFEVTGGRWGFWLVGGPMKFRYLYIHDNGRAVGDDLVGGMFIFTATENVIEYCYFKNNEIPGSPTGNNGNLMFDGDYRDTGGKGKAFQPDACVHKNTIRYNLFEGSVQGIRLKGDQRFGYNDRNPNPGSPLWAYQDFGDNIHHNIILNARDVGLRYGQDFSQIHNNIISNSNGQVIGKSDGHPVLYNQVIYNNTFIGSEAQYILRSAADSTSYDNYYDRGSGNPQAHIHVWLYNNIQSGYSGNLGAFRMQSDCDDDNWSAADVVFERNLLNNVTYSSRALRMGNTSSGSGCAAEYYSVSSFNSCSNIWRNTSGVLNWDVNGTLFQETSGASQYIIFGSFGLGGTSTVANAGIGGPHPYLSGISLPSYIGATNPADNAWVNGVLTDLSSVAWLKAQTGGDPSWIEGGEGFFVPRQVQGFKKVPGATNGN